MRLEPCAGKLACTVLRGGGGGNVVPLPDPSSGSCHPTYGLIPKRQCANRLGDSAATRRRNS